MDKENMANVSVGVDQVGDGEKSKATSGIDRINWTAAETFRLVQGGLLSRGIYLVNDFEKLEKERANCKC